MERVKKQNIIFLSIDSLRQSHLSCYGYKRKTTPNIDSFAANAVKFTQCIAQANWTLPSHFSMMTGMYPYFHGCTDEKKKLNPAIPVWPEIMREAGYATAAFTGGGYLSEDYNFNKGFSFFDAEKEPQTKKNKKIISWLKGIQQPFFLFLHSFDVHHPYSPPPEFDKFTEGEKIDVDTSKTFFQSVSDGGGKLGEKELGRIVDLYDGGISFFDSSFGELISGIKELGFWEDTFFIVTADHGEEFLDHGRMGHSDYSFYDELIKVPLLVKSPLHGALKIDDQIRHIDLMPTLLELLGIRANLKIHGKSFVPLLEGVTSARGRIAFNEMRTNVRVIRSVRAGGWKLIKREFMASKVFEKNWRKWLPRYTKKAFLLMKGNLRRGTKKKKVLTSGVELYSLKSDPHERENLAVKNREKLKELEEELKNWVESQGSTALKEPLKVTLEEKTQNQLKGLGYL